MEAKRVIPGSITFSRILFSLCLLALSPFSVPFRVLYLMCGVSDVLDGVIARRLHAESRAGERLDSLADLVFGAVYAVRILPLLRLPAWILIWIALIAAGKSIGIWLGYGKEQRFRIPHSAANKLTGALIFILPLTVRLWDVKCGAVIVCAAAALTAVQEVFCGDGRRKTRRNGS